MGVAHQLWTAEHHLVQPCRLVEGFDNLPLQSMAKWWWLENTGCFFSGMPASIFAQASTLNWPRSIAFFSNGESTLPTQWLMFLVAYWWYVLYWIVFNLVHWFQNVNSMVTDIIFVNLAMENPVFVLWWCSMFPPENDSGGCPFGNSFKFSQDGTVAAIARCPFVHPQSPHGAKTSASVLFFSWKYGNYSAFDE